MAVVLWLGVFRLHSGAPAELDGLLCYASLVSDGLLVATRLPPTRDTTLPYEHTIENGLSEGAKNGKAK